jgi:hypothetical protein
MGLHLSASVEAARTQALAQVHRPLEKASGAARAYFLAVQGLLSAAPLRPIAPSDLRVSILAVSGDVDPYDPRALYQTLLRGGARIEIVGIPGVGHGTCFSHPRFRELATRFVAAQERLLTRGLRA